MMHRFKSFLIGAMKTVGATATFLCAGHCTFQYVGGVVICTGPSMEPTLKDDDIIYCDYVITRFVGVNYGDIVISRSISNPDIYICKRVTGLAGDYMWNQRIKVPEGHVWLQGDNRSNSTDSRMYGAVPLALIRGRVIFRVWPLSSIQYFR